MSKILKVASGVFFLLLPSLCLSAVQVPAFLGKVDLGAPSYQLLVSADGRRVVARLKSSVRIVDISRPENPVIQGTLPLDNVSGRLFLTPDGRRGLLLQPPPQQYNYREEFRHVILEIDLTDPYHPRINNRREVLARYLTISEDATAYAASQSNPFYRPRPGVPGERWRTTVTWIDGRRTPVVIGEEIEEIPKFSFSNRATFLVNQRHGSSLRVIDLRPMVPVQYKQEFVFAERYRCMPAILASGHILIEDARSARLGVYAPADGVPRIATLPLDEGVEYCRRLDNDPSGEILTLSDLRGFVRRIDLRTPEQPSVAGSWQLPWGIYPNAVTKSLLIAAGGEEGRELQLFTLAVPVPPQVDWRALEAAYRKAMARYTVEHRVPDDVLGPLKAVQSLEEAGVLLALDATVEKIPPRRAAAIFNDYGFLASKTSIKSGWDEKAIRRSIALDPRRAPAVLNLADLLRGRLSRVTDYQARQKLAIEIESLYRRYRELGGKWNPSIESFMKRNPAAGDNEGVCGTIAAYANAGRLKEIVSSSALDVRAGDRKVDLLFGYVGTANAPIWYVFDAKTDMPLEDVIPVPKEEEEHSAGNHLGLVVHRDDAHILSYNDFRHPVDSFSVSGGLACRFRSDNVEKIGPKVLEPELCRQLRDEEGPPEIAFETPAPIDRAVVAKRYAETGANNMHRVDFANDGRPLNVVEMELASGAGAGCDSEFYELVDEDGALGSGAKHQLLMELQGAAESSRYPMICGNKVRFFNYRGKVYFENKPKRWAPDSEQDQYHRVTRVDKGKVVDVCDFRFETRISVEP